VYFAKDVELTALSKIRVQFDHQYSVATVGEEMDHECRRRRSFRLAVRHLRCSIIRIMPQGLGTLQFEAKTCWGLGRK
jgi:hypothetical protein